MEKKILNRRGPKPKAASEKKVQVKMWVKQKHYANAFRECTEIERKYNTNES